MATPRGTDNPVLLANEELVKSELRWIFPAILFGMYHHWIAPEEGPVHLVYDLQSCSLFHNDPKRGIHDSLKLGAS